MKLNTAFLFILVCLSMAHFLFDVGEVLRTRALPPPDKAYVQEVVLDVMRSTYMYNAVMTIIVAKQYNPSLSDEEILREFSSEINMEFSKMEDDILNGIFDKR